MSGIVIASIIVGIILLISVIGFATWYMQPAPLPPLPPPPPAPMGAMASVEVQQQVQPPPTPTVTEMVTQAPPAPICDALKCNSAMKNMIVTRNSAFGPASPYKNPLPDCANCSQVSYTWRPDMGLAYTKDGTTWVPCGTQQACYDAVKLPESFTGDAYFA